MPPATSDGDQVLGAAQRLRDAVCAIGKRILVETGEVIVRQGEAGTALYVVESGALDVVVQAGEDVRLPVARLGPGSHFGDMSLLTGTPVSAEVVSCEPTVLCAASAEQFRELLHRDPGLLEHFAGELAARLRQTNERLAAQQHQHEVLGRLVAAQHGCPFTADLPSMARSTAAAEAADDAPTLITGEEGVGKRALAQHIHALSARAERVTLVVECGSLPAEEAREQLFGGSEPTAVTRFADRLGFLQAADGGTLVLADVDRLPLDVQGDLATFLTTPHSPGSHNVSLRLIATSSRPLDELISEAAINHGLAELLAEGHLVAVAPLRKRRRDIVPLAEHFLACAVRRRGYPPRHLTASARRELQSYDFGFGNVAELRQVIELAANLAEGDAVGAEHLFFGPSGAEAPQIDLLRAPAVERAVVGGRVLAGLKVLVGLSFGGIAAACLIAPDHAIGRWANALAWGVWWPALIVSLLVLGRAWCAVCPLSVGLEAAQRAGGHNLPPPDRLSRLGPALALVGFVGIVWVEEATDMSHHPARTGLLLLSLALAAAAVGWVYQRHTWCRYLCPLGAMGGVFSVAASLRVRARHEVCVASCTGHECYKGTETSQGCPMFTHALHIGIGQHCKLCMRCVQDCPHDSPRLVLQPPLRDIWRSNLLSPDHVPLVAVIGLLALLLAATRAGFIHTPTGLLWFSGGCAAIAVLGLALVGLFAYRRRSDDTRTVSWTTRVIYAFVPVVGAILVAFRLRALTGLSDLSLTLGIATRGLVALSLLQIIQVAVAVLGGTTTLWALWRVSRLRFRTGILAAAAMWVGLGSLAVGCLVLALVWMT